MHLTRRQLDVLRFVRDYLREHALAPTLDEIAERFGVSKVTVHEHLAHLERKGWIRREHGRSRAISLVRDPDLPEAYGTPLDDVELPILGTITAGLPLEAIEDKETVSVSELVPHGPDHYLLKVRGDSMIEDHIQDGDYVILERRTTARDGEMVVAVLDDNEATLKRFYREGDKFRLQPANPNFPPMIVDRVEIRGVVVGVVRRLS